MIVTINGRRYRLSPGLTTFVRGFQKGFSQGLGWGVAISAVLFMLWLFLMAATHYVMWH